MKALLLTYVWLSYIVGAPLFVLYSVVTLTWICIQNKLDFGEFAAKDSMAAYFSGVVQGHKINMDSIDYIVTKEYSH